jgi:addiction module HigA family antidote
MRSRKRKPSHPGAILRAHHLEPLGLSITGAAERLGVSRKTLSKIINERGAVTPEMALRLSRGFGTSPQLWLNLQQAYDLWEAKRAKGWRQVRSISARAG